MSTLPFPPNVRRMNQEAYGSPQKGSCSSGLLEEGTPVIQASKNELRLKLLRRGGCIRGPEPLLPRARRSRGEHAGAAVRGLDRSLEVKIARR